EDLVGQCLELDAQPAAPRPPPARGGGSDRKYSRAARYPSKPNPEITPFAAAAVTIRCRSGSRLKTLEMWTSTTGLPEPRSASAHARLWCESAAGMMMIRFSCSG